MAYFDSQFWTEWTNSWTNWVVNYVRGILNIHIGVIYSNVDGFEMDKWSGSRLIRYVDLMWVTLLNHTRVFEWYVVRLVVKNVHQKHACYDKIGLSSQIYQPFIANGCVSMNSKFSYHPWCHRPCNPLLPIYNPPLLYMNQLYYEDQKICTYLF